jgi:small-conductance mechanosensitive channel
LTLSPASLLPFALPLGLTLAGLAVGLIVRRVVLARLARVAATTRSRVDDIVVAALRGPVVLWCTALGLYLATEVGTFPPGAAGVSQRILVLLVIVSMTWALARLAVGLVEYGARTAGGPLPSASLLIHVARLCVLGLGGLVILQTLGVSITPLLTALGVGGLAVGLALQDTLANFFAGIHILTSRQVRPGDFVGLASGPEGYVQDVTWRYTTIRQLANNLTMVPNSLLASTVITNYHLPDTELAVLIPVGVSYGSDLAHVERVTIAVGRDVMNQVKGGVPEFEPFIRYNTFADSSIVFTVILRGREFVDQYLIKHEFIKRLHVRYREEGIEIPFPIRTVHLHPDAAPGGTLGPA